MTDKLTMRKTIRFTDAQRETVRKYEDALGIDDFSEALRVIIDDAGNPLAPQHSVIEFKPCPYRALCPDEKKQRCYLPEKKRPIDLASPYVTPAICKICENVRQETTAKERFQQSTPQIPSQPQKINETYEKTTVSYRRETDTLADKRRIDELRTPDEKATSVLCSMKDSGKGEFRLRVNLDAYECLKCADQSCEIKKEPKPYVR